MRSKAVHAAAVLSLLGLALGTHAWAQEIVAAAPSNTQAVAAGDEAVVAVAQVNDAADAATAQKKVDLYKQLMELNGTSRNIRNVLGNTKITTRLIVIQRMGTTALTPDQDARYNTVADTVLKQTEATVIDEIAQGQAQSFSADEIQQLINANASPAAAKYNAAKFLDSDTNAAQVQTYMVDAVVKIIKTFTQSVSS